MSAPSDDYLAYRRVRVSAKLEQRMQASVAYLERFPNGRWSDQVRPWFERAEARYFEHRRDDASGLATYLELLPTGPHAGQARALLEVLRARARQAQKERLGLEAMMTEERLGALAAQREQARDAVPMWVGRMLAIDTWGERTSRLDGDMLFAWRMDQPRARCVDERCAKIMQLPFALPGGGESAMREMVIEVVIVLGLADGGVEEGRVEGPQLFSRLFEASKAKPVAPDDTAARVQAISHAVEVVAGAAEARLPKDRCAVEAVAPVVLARRCDGWTLTVRAAELPTDDDVVVVRGPRGKARD
jgi:hypothetical protein